MVYVYRLVLLMVLPSSCANSFYALKLWGVPTLFHEYIFSVLLNFLGLKMKYCDADLMLIVFMLAYVFIIQIHAVQCCGFFRIFACIHLMIELTWWTSVVLCNGLFID